MQYRLAFVGPQGCGKGTQAIKLSKRLGIPQITPGVMYRQEIARGTERGKQIAPIVDSGGMVPDAVTNAIIRDRVAQPDCAKGFILDGYPRTIEQVRALDELPQPLTHVVFLKIDDELAVQRLSDRWVCVCGVPYAGKELTLRKAEARQCDECQGALSRRADDEPAAVRRRLQIYHERTEPIIAEYRKRGALIEIDGSGSVEAVYAEILAKLGIT